MRARSRWLAASALVVASLVPGCDVEPFCFTCAERDAGEEREGGVDSGGGSFDAGRREDAMLPDAEMLGDGCLASELCNSLDDDCDGLVDEGIDTRRDPRHCGACGRVCAPVHAFPRCADGVCEIEDCDVGFLDLDMDPSNGCEYRCLPVAMDDVICDLRDDDCDGRVDEDVDRMTDMRNCGRCGRVCRAVHASGTCEAGVCTRGACDPGFYDIDGLPGNGCEYACTVADPPTEVCNARDEDCDGTVDEGDPGGGVECGSAVGACVAGATRCTMGAVLCVGGVSPSTELCDGTDDDCDGRVDELNPQGGRVCGTSVGTCDSGREVCTGGALVCTGGVDPVAEACNDLDDDCDGTTDEGNPGGGASCGETAGACEAGMMTCTRGALVCTGDGGPRDELCNAVDDDCDGRTDEGDPESGGLCGTDVGRCSTGTRRCTSGALTCVGAVGPGTETCDGSDEDCDGRVDEGNPGGGAACGSTVGRCTAGMQTCRTGTLVCEGGTGPTAETCNGLDEDCDGRVDETFALMTDVSNCGMCGRACSFPNAVPTCAMGSCRIGSCLAGFHDLDPMAPGCEYACSFRGGEVCNGVDDDCDGRTDESLTPPASFCNPNGVCAMTSASCGGAMGWTCNYPAATYRSADSICDGLDNDCDGLVDEGFPLVGTSCSNGQGTCRRTGSYVCNATRDGVQCNAAAAGTPASEACNALDDDCDGLVDEVGPDLPGTPHRDAIDVSAISTVSVSRAGRNFRIMQFEASRPDATATSAGTQGPIACSRSGVMPWTSVTQAQAQAACCALNVGGACPGAGAAGWRLCDAADWQIACEGPAGTCDWSYQTMCTASQPTRCNGQEYDCNTSLPGDQDCPFVTGSSTFPGCGTDWGAAAGGMVRDLSGNVREWTATLSSPGFYQVRGGSYQSIEAGRACDFAFTVAATAGPAPNTGFRCCLY